MTMCVFACVVQPEPIRSHFYVTYGSALQMLATRDLSACRQLVERSFGSFLASSNQRRADAARDAAENQLAEYEAVLGAYTNEELAAYVKLQERLTSEVRTESYLLEQEAATTTATIESLLPFVRSGTAAKLADGSDALLLDDAPRALAAKLPTLFASVRRPPLA